MPIHPISENKTSSSNTLIAETSQAISFAAVRNKQPDRTFFLNKKKETLQHFLSNASEELYHSLATTFSLDQINSIDFKKYLWPILSSGAALTVGELATTGLSAAFTQQEEYEVLFKFLLGSGILSYCAAQRITEQRPQTTTEFSAAMASEIVGITYMYTSTFNGSQMLLQDKVSESSALVSSLGISGLAVPGLISYLTQKIQEKLTRGKYVLGAQRSDTAIIPSGLTPLSNTYFQANHFIREEIAALSRSFQLGLISNNVLNEALPVTQFRNVPALGVDVMPAVIEALVLQQKKIDEDYRHNTAKQKVLRVTKQGPELIEVERYQLRNGDLVACNDNFDFDSVPVSGEIVSFALDADGKPTTQLVPKEVSINLKAHNGEDVWIKSTTSNSLPNQQKKVDLHAIHEGKQAGILAGAKLNLNGNSNCYICIQDQTERTFSSNYAKKSIIDQIINDYKQRQVIYSMVLAGIMAALQSNNLADFSANALRLLFNFTQMMIPFSETFLRKMVNDRLMKEINKDLRDTPMQTIDALRVVDFFNTLSGYYHNRFPHGVAIVSDKTGTLTTAKMEVLGCWTAGMPPHVQQLLHENSVLLPEEQQKQFDCYEVFTHAFTNSRKELEPEEFAILQMFQDNLFAKKECLKIDILGNTHFRKTISLAQGEKTVDTYHLGLHRSLGGRFTLVSDGEHNYLVFCGVPKADKFHGMPLLESYATMTIRTGVLSRDWCVAQAPLSDSDFAILKALYDQNNKEELEHLLCNSPSILKQLVHYGTFLINNPVKKGVEKFISQCREASVPVFIATGDTTKSAENIAKVLSPDNIEHIITIRTKDVASWQDKPIPKKSTIVFSGINNEILSLFGKILSMEIQHRPTIIFSEMTTENKGTLAQYLKKHQYFVVANGDGSNDVAMMRYADLVIAHVTDEGNYAPGIEQFANFSDRQLRGILSSDRSFYELFDIHEPHGLFMRAFAPLANSQEKPSLALLLKSSKMSFELIKSLRIGLEVKDIPALHWWGVAFDLSWLWLSFGAVNATTDLPMDNQSLDNSDFALRCQLFTFVVAFVQAFLTYGLSGESTNLTWMIIMLSFLPIMLRSIFAGYGPIQEEIVNSPQITELPDDVDQLLQVHEEQPAVVSETTDTMLTATDVDNVGTELAIPQRHHVGITAFISSFFHRKKAQPSNQCDKSNQTEPEPPSLSIA